QERHQLEKVFQSKRCHFCFIIGCWIWWRILVNEENLLQTEFVNSVFSRLPGANIPQTVDVIHHIDRASVHKDYIKPYCAQYRFSGSGHYDVYCWSIRMLSL